MACFVSSDKPTQLTLIPQRHSERFHDLQSNRRTNEYGTRRIRYHRCPKAKTTTKASIIERISFQGPKGTLLSIRPLDNNLRNLPSFRKQPGSVPHWTLEVEGMDPQRGTYFFRTQSPLLPSSARPLLTYAPHRLIIHPHHS